MTYSICLHDEQDLRWGNASRDTSEEPQSSGLAMQDRHSVMRVKQVERKNSKLNGLVRGKFSLINFTN